MNHDMMIFFCLGTCIEQNLSVMLLQLMVNDCTNFEQNAQTNHGRNLRQSTYHGYMLIDIQGVGRAEIFDDEKHEPLSASDERMRLCYFTTLRHYECTGFG
jgi:hypothetical protein